MLLLIDYVLGSGESDTTEMSLRVVIREVMHRLNDVTEHKKKRCCECDVELDLSG